jgi:hypothetical protein
MQNHAIWLYLGLLVFGCVRVFGLNLADAAEDDLKAVKETITNIRLMWTRQPEFSISTVRALSIIS